MTDLERFEKAIKDLPNNEKRSGENYTWWIVDSHTATSKTRIIYMFEKEKLWKIVVDKIKDILL